MEHSTYKGIFRDYYRSLVVFAVSRYGLRHDEAEDVVQDVFVRMWNNNHNMNKSEIMIRSFLYTSVRNGAIDVIRTKKRHNSCGVEDIDKEISPDKTIEMLTIDFENETLRNEKIRKMYVAIESLPSKCREIFKKIYFEEKDYAAVACELGLSLNTVKVQMFRAYSKLREELMIIILLIFLSYFL